MNSMILALKSGDWVIDISGTVIERLDADGVGHDLGIAIEDFGDDAEDADDAGAGSLKLALDLGEEGPASTTAPEPNGG